jgi:hypothetical protein
MRRLEKEKWIEAKSVQRIFSNVEQLLPVNQVKVFVEK